MDKRTQIEEMALDIIKESSLPIEISGALAIGLYNAGYRKVEQGEWVMRENKSPTEIEAYCSKCGRDAVYQVISLGQT